MMKSVKVLMVGSSLKVKGGMTTVVQSFLQHEFPENIKLSYIATHSEKGKLYNTLFFANSLVQILCHLLLRNPHIIHMHMSERGSFYRKYIIYRMSKALGKKVVIHTHGAEFKEFYLAASVKTKKRIVGMLDRADKVIALGNSWEKILHGISPQANTFILRNSVPIPLYKKADHQNPQFAVLFLAVLNERKGILDLIEASRTVIQEAAGNKKYVVFHIAGDGHLMSAAKKLVTSYSLEEFYHFHGWINKEQKKLLLEKTDLFVLPSYNEGLPLSVLEALSYGIPIIATDVGSISEAVEEGRNGFLIEPGDIRALTDKLQAVINSPSREEMGKASRKLALEQFNQTNYFKHVEELYREKSQ